MFRRDRMSNGLPYTTLSPLELFILSADESSIDAFLSYMPADFIFTIRLLNKSMFYAVEAYKMRHWDIERFLARWFPNPALFLSVLHQSDGIISGSEAMQFFRTGKRTFRGNDLDIYVPYHGLLTMGRFVRRSGFIYQPAAYPFFDAAVLMFTAMNNDSTVRARCGSPPSTPNKPKTFDFSCPASQHFGPLRGGKLQIIGVPGNPIEWIINNFHSSEFGSLEMSVLVDNALSLAAVMNYLAPTHAVSIFPRTTFVDRATLVCQDMTSLGHSTMWMQKYRNRGFRIVTGSDPVPCTRELRAWQHRVGDQFTWVMPYTHGKLHKSPAHISAIDESDPMRFSLVVEIRNRPHVHPYAFEVLDESYEVVPPGAALRVCPRFMFR